MEQGLVLIPLFDCNKREPKPTTSNNSVDVWPLVIKDMKNRDKIGKIRYGTPLKTKNGRKALIDAYQEVLDLAVYLRQEIEERFQNEDTK